MSIVACPRCRDEVTLPARLSPQARVRCPLCRDEYTLSEALAKMPPMLIVVDAGPDADVGGYGEPEYKVASDAAPAMGGVFDSSPAMGDAPAMPRAGVKGSARPKKKSGGGAVSQIVQVVMGGIGAFVLFHVLAWYTPMLGYQDPMGAGPFVAKYVPSIVPEKFRGGAPSGGTNKKGSDLAKNGGTTPPVPAVVKNKKNGSVFDTGDKFKGLDPNDVKPMFDPLDPGGAPAIPPEEAPVIPPEEPEVMIDDPLNPKPMPNKKPPVDKPIDFTPPMPKPEDPNAKTPVGSAEITGAYANAVNKREDFEASVKAGEEAAVIKQKGKDLYEAAAELGKLCAEADMTEAENADKLSLIKDELVMKMTGNGARLTMLAVFADPALADGGSAEGIAVGGVIKDFKDLGATQEMTIEVTRQNGTLFTLPIVLSKSLEGDGAKVGDKAIVLGKIVRDPKKDLPKYKGEAPQVIVAGHTTLVPGP